MTQPSVDRPQLFGGRLEPTLLPWSWAEERLVESPHYWIATTRADGRPHVRPVWAVWLDGRLFFSTGSLAGGHLERSPEISVNLESGGEVVIVEGTAAPVDDMRLLVRIADVYNEKYAWDLDPADLPGPFWAVRPRVVFGWVSDPSGLDGGAAFHGTNTRWRFDP